MNRTFILALIANLYHSVLAFSPSSNRNVAIYWGQNSAAYGQLPLRTYCDSDAVDIVLLAFMMDFPTWAINLSNADQGLTTPQGKSHFPKVGSDISYCQSRGKIVLLSMGGALGTHGFTSDSEATEFAATLWNTFGGGNTLGADRPFGSAILDGFDLDIENKNPQGYAALVDALRIQYASDPARRYYVSASPQCVYPDASVGDALARSQIDFAFIQFYNNYCNLDGHFNWDAWQTFADTASPNKDIKLYVGLPGAPLSANNGYLSADQVEQQLPQSVLQSRNFGGISIWDMASSFANVAQGRNFAQLIKSLLMRNPVESIPSLLPASLGIPITTSFISPSPISHVPPPIETFSSSSELSIPKYFPATIVTKYLTVTAPTTVTKFEYETVTVRYFFRDFLYRPDRDST